jgi:hypothetical protein
LRTWRFPGAQAGTTTATGPLPAVVRYQRLSEGNLQVWLLLGSLSVLGCYARCMIVRDVLTALQALPRDAELLTFEAG